MVSQDINIAKAIIMRISLPVITILKKLKSIRAPIFDQEHNAASMRAFVVEAKPQRKRRRRAWPGYARSALKLSPMTYENPTSSAFSGGYAINSVPVHLLGTLTSSGFIRIGCSFKACKILSANDRGKRPSVPYLEATMPSTAGLWFKNRCKYSALPNTSKQLLNSVPKRYAGSQ